MIGSIYVAGRMEEPRTDDDPTIASIPLVTACEGADGPRKHHLVCAGRRHTEANGVYSLFATERHDQLGFGSACDQLFAGAPAVQKAANFMMDPCGNPLWNEPNAVADKSPLGTLDRGPPGLSILEFKVGGVRMLTARLPDHDIDLGRSNPDDDRQ
jgi:hypothetical protein